MAPRSRISRESILSTATKLVSESGAAALTFQAIGDRLGVSKQAVIYWFPSKGDLARELIVPALEREAEAVATALKRVRTAHRAIEVFIRTLVAFHLSDLARFRLIYAVAQFDPQIMEAAELPSFTDAIHAATGRMYAALEAALARAPDFRDPPRARVTAAAVHTAAVGLISMISLAEAVKDPLAHSTGGLLDALVELMTGQGFLQPSSL